MKTVHLTKAYNIIKLWKKKKSYMGGWDWKA